MYVCMYILDIFGDMYVFMYVCMYVCIYIYTCIHIHTHTHTYILDICSEIIYAVKLYQSIFTLNSHHLYSTFHYQYFIIFFHLLFFFHISLSIFHYHTCTRPSPSSVSHLFFYYYYTLCIFIPACAQYAIKRAAITFICICFSITSLFLYLHAPNTPSSVPQGLQGAGKHVPSEMDLSAAFVAPRASTNSLKN